MCNATATRANVRQLIDQLTASNSVTPLLLLAPYAHAQMGAAMNCTRGFVYAS
jgi:hypothetical protein